MEQAVLRIDGLPARALDAAAAFHASFAVQARKALAEREALAIVLPPAPYDHAGWRQAAIADLAREAAPKRVNGVTGGDAAAIAEALAWLDQAPGITGQVLAVDAIPADEG